MSLEITLDRVLLDRKMTLSRLSQQIGLSLANLSRIKTNKAKAIRLSTLDAICRELDCQPQDLIRYKPVPLPQAANDRDILPTFAGDSRG